MVAKISLFLTQILLERGDVYEFGSYVPTAASTHTFGFSGTDVNTITAVLLLPFTAEEAK